MAAPNWIRDHPVNEDLANLIEALDRSASAIKDLPTPAEANQHVSRLKAIASHVRRLLKAADPLLTPRIPVDNLQTPIQQATSEINQFIGDSNSGRLLTAVGHGETALSYLPTLYVPTSRVQVEELADASADYRDSLTNIINSLDARRADVATKYDELVEALDALADRITTQTTELASIKSQAESERQSAVTEATTSIGQTEATFLEEARQAIESHTTAWKLSTKERDEQATETLAKIQARYDQALAVMESLGKVAVTGGYAGAAQAEGRARHWLRLLAICLFLVGVAIGFYSLIFKPPPTVDLAHVIARLGVVLAIGLTAYYVAREASIHGRNEAILRMYAVQLSSIDPYLALLDKASQDSAKKDLTTKFFGNFDALRVEEDDSSVAAGPIWDLLKKVIDRVIK